MPETPKRDYRGHGSAYKPELDAVPLAANAQDACLPCRFETATGGGVETRPARQQPCCWHCPQLPLAAQSTCQPKSAREPKKKERARENLPRPGGGGVYILGPKEPRIYTPPSFLKVISSGASVCSQGSRAGETHTFFSLKKCVQGRGCENARTF